MLNNTYHLNFNINVLTQKETKTEEDFKKFVENMCDFLKELTGTQQIQIIKFEKEDEWKEDEILFYINMQVSSNNASQMNKIKHIILENENKTLPDGKHSYLVGFDGNNDDGKNFKYNNNLSYFEFCFQYKFAQKFQFQLAQLNLSMDGLYELTNYWFKKVSSALFYVENNTLREVEAIDDILNKWQPYIEHELHLQDLQTPKFK